MHILVYAGEQEKDSIYRMKPKPKRIHCRPAVDPRDHAKSLNIKARYLKKLALAFLSEFVTELETFGTDQNPLAEDRLSLRDEVRRFEIDLIKCALQQAGGSQTRAATLLGVKTTTLNSKIKLYRLQPALFRRTTKSELSVFVVSNRSRPMLANAIAEESGATGLN